MLSDSEEEKEHPDGSFTRISWRMDPEESLSDWTIIISSPCGLSATYHVHKSFLSVECQYFARLFRKSADKGQQFSEFADCTSRFNFDQKKAVEFFPDFLDFLYGSENQSTSSKYITIENAVALYYLAEYFGCRHLRRIVRRFFEDNLSNDTLASFYEDSKQFQNEKFHNEIAEYCAMNVDKLDVANPIATVSDHVFWSAVVGKTQHPSSTASEKLSLLVAEFCSRRCQDLDLNLLAQLTDESKLPKIHHQAAIELMAVEHTLKSFLKSNESTNTNLRIRCQNSLSGSCSKVNLDQMADSLNLVDSNMVHILKVFQEDLKRSQQRRYCYNCGSYM